MTRNAIESSNIKSVGYDKASLTLEIEFGSGGVYQYYGVLPEHHSDLMAAESIGKHFHAHIKGRYEWKKIEEKETKEA